MKAETFLSIARERISDNPMSRVSELTRNKIEHDHCIFDPHCHIFDRKSLSIGYIALRFARQKVADLLDFESTSDFGSKLNLLKQNDSQVYEYIRTKTKDTAAEWADFEAEIEAMVAEADKNKDLESLGGLNWKGLRDTWSVLRKDSKQSVYDYYEKELAICNIVEYQNHPFVSGILMMDLETGWDIQPEKSFFKQIDELKALTQERPILPFLAVDPRRADREHPSENLYELFLKAFTEGNTPFFGVKCYPALGYFPSDARLEPIFQICEEKNIPITSHCGGEAVSTYEKTIRIKNSTGFRNFKIPGGSQGERARFLNNPGHWDCVLAKFPNLKLNLAHFASGRDWAHYIETGSSERIEKIIQMMTDHPGVYTDYSFNVCDSALFDKLRETMEKFPSVHKKLMFGTDFWVVLPYADLPEKQAKFMQTMQGLTDQLTKHNTRDFFFEKIGTQPQLQKVHQENDLVAN